ncbi:MAG: aldehyde dehydrogenase family protein, partial [Bacteroidales bacterium]|nr:aldehyde dehydrogenase family protein [Bacteroidales bacterium]
MSNIANTPVSTIAEVVKAQKDFFSSGKTLDIDFRKQMLKEFQKALIKWEKPLCDALWQDLHKSYEEAYLTEISIVKAEIRNHIKNVKRWARKENRPTPIKLFPASSHIVKEPLGNTLIISPWNYPVQLLLNPLVGAISSGCTAILKPSPYVPTVSAVLQQMIEDTFASQYVAVVQGNRDVNAALLEHRYDLIFFTGSPALAKTVMAAAAKHLTPLVLELGGKSPCVIDKEADIKLAAKRIAWGKTINSGQTCIAPDYILIHEDVKAEFAHEFGKAVHELHGSDVAESNHYVRMVNQKAFERVSSYLKEGTVISGGHTDPQSRYIEPTLLDNVALNSKVMTEEIFGPIFPIISFKDNFQQQ